jgi:hypothetical protein
MPIEVTPPRYGPCKAMDGLPARYGTPLLTPANPKCVCPTALAAILCMTGHLLECHYPLSCEEAQCEHFFPGREKSSC